MKSWVEIIAAETGDSLPSVMAVFDGKKYLFNAGEGAQRICIENRVKLTKLGNIFLSRVQWDACGGIPGMMLSLATAGNTDVMIHGGNNLTHFMAATRHFVFRMASTVKTYEIPDESVPFRDSNITVTPVKVYPAGYVRSSDVNHASTSNGGVADNMDTDLPTDSNGSIRRKRKAIDQIPISELTDSDATFYREEIIRQMFNSGETPSAAGTFRSSEPDPKKARLDEEDDTDNPFVPNVQNAKKDFTRLERLPKAERSPDVITFICQGPDLRGKFHAEKAISLGIPPSWNRRLIAGETFVSKDGSVTVLPEEVMDPIKVGPIFIIVDCPSVDYIEPLKAHPHFAGHYADVSANPPALMVHNVGDDVVDSQEYRQWMQMFGEGCQHILISRKYGAKPIIFQKFSTGIHRLNKLDPDVFKIPFYQLEAKPFENAQGLPSKLVMAEGLLKFQLQPTLLMDRTEMPTPWNHQDPTSRLVESLETNHRLNRFLAIAASTRAEIEATKATAETMKVPGDDVLICTLGTGASLPSRFRNVSATLAYIPGHGSILFDVGEGTYGQLFRRFHQAQEEPELEDVLCSLKFLFVSHMHADHHLGAARLLIERKKALVRRGGDIPKLVIACSLHYITWLQEYSDCEDLGLDTDIDFLVNDDLMAVHQVGEERLVNQHAIYANLLASLSLTSVTTSDVDHAPYAYAVSVVHSSGFRLVYSGDCRPNLDLMRTVGSANSSTFDSLPTLLIHEATFHNDEHGSNQAQRKRHTTTREAVIVGEKMRSDWILLTHFSTRYPSNPDLGLGGMDPADRERRTRTVGVAFDLMAVQVGRFRRCAMYADALDALFPSRIEDAPDVTEEDLKHMDELVDEAPGVGGD
ncbi:hypothetical protein HKX48_006440, partial [Thoreauomyces humboldtii]